MSDGVLGVLTVGAALGCGVIAGVFFAFSSFVMTALAKLPPAGSGGDAVDQRVRDHRARRRGPARRVAVAVTAAGQLPHHP
jgi:hypothetical protein